MRAILISIQPPHVCNILNIIKLWEIRKKFPKDYVGWVYIYCTKDSSNLLHKNCANIYWLEDKDFQKKNKRLGIETQPYLNGKVVARFYCDNVERYINGCKLNGEYSDYEYILKPSCLTEDELYDYCEDLSFSAIYITRLEIFDRPKELSEFYKEFPKPKYLKVKTFDQKKCYAFGDFYEKTLGKYKTEKELKGAFEKEYQLTKAPQSYQFIEVKE